MYTVCPGQPSSLLEGAMAGESLEGVGVRQHAGVGLELGKWVEAWGSRTT